jgi:hypothetical protein
LFGARRAPVSVKQVAARSSSLPANPVTRARELGGYAGATADYVVVAHAAVADAVACETHAHGMLKHCRRKGTELFDVSPGRARAVIFAVARSTYAARRVSPSRRDFRRRFNPPKAAYPVSETLGRWPGRFSAAVLRPGLSPPLRCPAMRGREPLTGR